MQTNALSPLSQGLPTDTNRRLTPLSIPDWAAVWSPVAEMHALHPRNEDGTSHWRGFVHGRLAGAQFATGCQLVQRSKRLALTPNGALAIQNVSSGAIAMDYETRSFVQRPGYISIIDLSQTFKASYQQAVGEMIFIPRELLGFSQSDRVEPALVPTDSMQGKMLTTELHHFFKPEDEFGDERLFDANTLLHLTNSILSSQRHPSSDRVEWWRARNTLIRAHIEENLGDLSLLPAQICDKFNLSRATLYRMFEVDGGVRRYIQDRRLYAAVWDLAEGGIHRGRLTEVAEKWGFSSNANFNRAVKTVFEMPPGALFRGPALIIPSRLEHRQEEFPVYAWFARLQREKVLIY
ncbi:MAG: helix-turn-helix transcriptional regulator [Pseudomonadota bacterium]